MEDEELRELYRWLREHSAIPNGDGNSDAAKEPRPDPVLQRALKYLDKKTSRVTP